MAKKAAWKAKHTAVLQEGDLDAPRARIRRLTEEYEPSRYLNVADLADNLYEYYMEVQPYMDGWVNVDQNRFAEKIPHIFTAADIDYLLRLDFGKGLIIGAVMALCAAEDSVQEQIDERMSELDMDAEELTDEELEGFVIEGITGGFGSNDHED